METSKLKMMGKTPEERTNNLLIKNLSETGKVFLMGSEEIESVIIPHPNNKNAEFIVVFDPLDGSSNIDVSVTKLFSDHKHHKQFFKLKIFSTLIFGHKG